MPSPPFLLAGDPARLVLVRPGPGRARLPRPDSPRHASREGRPRPGRGPARRRQRRDQHSRPVRRRWLCPPPGRPSACRRIACSRSTTGSACTRRCEAPPTSWSRAGWRSCRGSATRTRTAPTSRAWPSGRRPASTSRAGPARARLGRALDATADRPDVGAEALSIGAGPPSVALRGRRSVASALDRLDDLRLDAEVASAGGRARRARSGRRPARLRPPEHAGRLRVRRSDRRTGRRPRRRRPLPGLGPGRSAPDDRPPAEGRSRRPGLLRRPGRVRHPRRPAPDPRPSARGAVGGVTRVPGRPGGLGPRRSRARPVLQRVRPPRGPRTARRAPTTAPPPRSCWPAPPSGRVWRVPIRAWTTSRTAT